MTSESGIYCLIFLNLSSLINQEKFLLLKHKGKVVEQVSVYVQLAATAHCLPSRVWHLIELMINMILELSSYYLPWTAEVYLKLQITKVQSPACKYTCVHLFVNDSQF